METGRHPGAIESAKPSWASQGKESQNQQDAQPEEETGSGQNALPPQKQPEESRGGQGGQGEASPLAGIFLENEFHAGVEGQSGCSGARRAIWRAGWAARSSTKLPIANTSISVLTKQR